MLTDYVIMEHMKNAIVEQYLQDTVRCMLEEKVASVTPHKWDKIIRGPLELLILCCKTNRFGEICKKTNFKNFATLKCHSRKLQEPKRVKFCMEYIIGQLARTLFHWSYFRASVFHGTPCTSAKWPKIHAKGNLDMPNDTPKI